MKEYSDSDKLNHYITKTAVTATKRMTVKQRGCRKQQKESL